MHLQIAEAVRMNPSLRSDVRVHLGKEYSAFCLGNVAPDYQTICDIPRELTHFYSLPPRAEDNAYQTMLERYPQLTKSSSLSPRHSAFIAAYAAHLMLDLRWYHEVLIPYFVKKREWDEPGLRFVVHNTLLAHLDRMAYDSLPGEMATTLAAAEPENWLPFADDKSLCNWRDMLVAQMLPGGQIQTIRIYAQRLLMTPDEFTANLERPAWMEEHLFSRVPVETVRELMRSAVDDSVRLIESYLAESL